MLRTPLYDCHTSSDEINIREDSWILFDESSANAAVKLEEQFDEEIGCEVIPLLQGAWVIADSAPEVDVEISGGCVMFSDGRSKSFIRRAYKKSTPDAIEWLLGNDTILVKSLSSFITPQRIFFARLRPDKQQRGSGLEDICLVLTRAREPITMFYSAASTASCFESG
jgi:hypothetical protein